MYACINYLELLTKTTHNSAQTYRNDKEFKNRFDFAKKFNYWDRPDQINKFKFWSFLNGNRRLKYHSNFIWNVKSDPIDIQWTRNEFEFVF